jgi:hypothetical protein
MVELGAFSMGWIFAGFCLAAGAALFYFCAPLLAGVAVSWWRR